MHILYLDDSGSTNNKDEEYLILGGVAVFERGVYWITDKMDKLAASLYPENPNAVEFHASEIFSGRRPPWKGMGKESRRDVIKKVLQILADSDRRTCAFACAVHKNSCPGADPMEMAFEDLCSRFDLYLNRLYHVNQDSQKGLIILDESSYETSLQKIAKEFRTLGTRWRVLRNMAEVPLFVDSKASRLVQLADHVAYATFRYYQAEDTSYFNIILPKFDSEDGKLHGLVHRQNVDSDCMCPACMSRRLTNQQTD